MVRLFQVFIIGLLCAGVFALLYGNATPATVSFFGETIATGSLGSFLLISFFSGLLIASFGAFVIGIGQSIMHRRIAARDRRLQSAWNKFADAQLSSLLNESSIAEQKYRELRKAAPEALAVLAPLFALGDQTAVNEVRTQDLPASSSALVEFLHAKIAEREGSFVRAAERYIAAYDAAKLPELLRLARDASLKADLVDKARALHQKLAQSTKLTDDDIIVEAKLAALDLSTNSEERPAKLRDLVRRYPNSDALVEELAELETKNGKLEQAAILLGRAAKLNPSATRIAAFEKALQRLSLERSLSIIDQSAKGAPDELFIPSKLAILIHHRAVSAASDLWASTAYRTTERMQKLGAALSIVNDNRDAAINALCAASNEDALIALNPSNDAKQQRVVGLAPQFSTP